MSKIEFLCTVSVVRFTKGILTLFRDGCSQIHGVLNLLPLSYVTNCLLQWRLSSMHAIAPTTAFGQSLPDHFQGNVHHKAIFVNRKPASVLIERGILQFHKGSSILER